MKLVRYPNEGLTSPCFSQGQSVEDKARLASKMWKIMNKNHGAGLAAPQVGLQIRMFVWKDGNKNMAIWNPTLLCVSGEANGNEGCLSLPRIIVSVKRATSSVLVGTDETGGPVRLVGGEISTRIWQHEIDHLDGKLILDYMTEEESVANRDAIRFLLGDTVA